ncbi:MAG: hypothetical protein JKY95_08050 [Planctomycetaceae bacterium]|nr:hypothetical protein [Planctomycetaceae bacterium]
MRIFVGLTAVCLSLSLFTSSLHAADGPELIPSSAAAVIRLNAPDKTIESLADFVNDIQPGFGALVQGQAGMMGVGISNPTMQGVDKSRDFWGAVFIRKDAEPAIVFIIPATDVEEMKEAVDESLEFIAHDGYGIYTKDKIAADLMRKHLESSRPDSIVDNASQEMIKIVSGTDIAVVLNLVEIKSVYATELSDGKDKFLEEVEKAQSQMLEVPGVNLAWVPGLMEKLGEKLFNVVEDSQAYAVTFSVKKSGLELQEYLEFSDGSGSAKFLAKNPPESLTILNQLPAEQLGYFAIGGDLSDLNKWGMFLLPQILDMSDEQKKKWETLAEKFEDIDFGGISASFALGDTDSGLIRASTITKAKPTKLIREISQIAAEVMNDLELPGGMKQEMTIEQGVEEVDGVKIDLMTTKTVAGNAQAGGIQTQINQIMYGGDSIETRIAYLDGVNIQTVGGGKKSMKSALAAFKSNAAGSDEVIARDTKSLGAKHNFLAIIDIPSLIVQGLKIAASSPDLPPMPFDEDSVADLDVERSYLGFSIRTSDTGCAGKVHVPKETIKAGLALFGFFQEIQGNRNAF